MRISILLAALSLSVSCVPRDPAPAAIRPVKVTVAAGAASIDKSFAGMATPDDAVNLAFKLSGQVREIPVSLSLISAGGKYIGAAELARATSLISMPWLSQLRMVYAVPSAVEYAIAAVGTLASLRRMSEKQDRRKRSYGLTSYLSVSMG